LTSGIPQFKSFYAATHEALEQFWSNSFPQAIDEFHNNRNQATDPPGKSKKVKTQSSSVFSIIKCLKCRAWLLVIQ